MGYWMQYIVADKQEVSLSWLEAKLKEVRGSYAIKDAADGDDGETGELMFDGELYGEIHIGRPGQDTCDGVLEGMKEEVAQAKKGPRRARVAKTLGEATAVVAMRVLYQGRGTDETLENIQPMWEVLFANRKGLLYADMEGFYDSNRLILKEPRAGDPAPAAEDEDKGRTEETAKATATTAFTAAETGDHRLLKSIAAEDASLLAVRGSEGLTPALLAAERGYADCLEIIANVAPQTVYAAAKDGTTPAMAACQQGHASCLEVLADHDPRLLQGAWPLFDDPQALAIAHSAGHAECVQVIAKRGHNRRLREKAAALLREMQDRPDETSLDGAEADMEEAAPPSTEPSTSASQKKLLGRLLFLLGVLAIIVSLGQLDEPWFVGSSLTMAVIGVALGWVGRRLVLGSDAPTGPQSESLEDVAQRVREEFEESWDADSVAALNANEPLGTDGVTRDVLFEVLELLDAHYGTNVGAAVFADDPQAETFDDPVRLSIRDIAELIHARLEGRTSDSANAQTLGDEEATGFPAAANADPHAKDRAGKTPSGRATADPSADANCSAVEKAKMSEVKFYLVQQTSMHWSAMRWLSYEGEDVEPGRQALDTLKDMPVKAEKPGKPCDLARFTYRPESPTGRAMAVDGYAARLVQLLHDNGIPNFDAYPLTVASPKNWPECYCLDVRCQPIQVLGVTPGHPARATPEQGQRLVRAEGLYFDPEEWGGEEVFTIGQDEPPPLCCTERVKELIEEAELRNVALVPFRPRPMRVMPEPTPRNTLSRDALTETSLYWVETGLSRAYVDQFDAVDHACWHDWDYPEDLADMSFETDNPGKAGDISDFSLGDADRLRGLSARFVELLRADGITNFDVYLLKAIGRRDWPEYHYLDVNCREIPEIKTGFRDEDKKSQAEREALDAARSLVARGKRLMGDSSSGSYFDLDEWGGEDLFMVYPLLACTERVKGLAEKAELRNVEFRPLHTFGEDKAVAGPDQTEDAGQSVTRTEPKEGTPVVDKAKGRAPKARPPQRKLRSLAQGLEPLIKPAAVLTLKQTDAPDRLSIAGSHFGGQPYAEEGDTRPVCPKCENGLTFICQVNAAKIKTQPVPDVGLFTFFYCLECFPFPVGEDDDHELEGQWVVRFYDEPTNSKAVVIDDPTGEAASIWPCSVRARAVNRLPGWEELRTVCPEAAEFAEGKSDDGWDYYDEAAARLTKYRSSDNHTVLGGYPLWMQGDYTPMCPECGERMASLIDIASDKAAGLQWGDEGHLYLFYCPSHPGVVRMVIQSC